MLNSINKQVNPDLKNLWNGLKANEIFSDTGKTELVLFTSPKKQIDGEFKIILNGKNYETDLVKYLGIQIDKNLTCKQQIDRVVIGLNKGNAMISKLRHVLDIKTLRPVYYTIFESHLRYTSFVWAQKTNSVKRLHLFLQKALRTMFFQSRNSNTGPLFKEPKIPKSIDKTALENCGFIKKSRRFTTICLQQLLQILI